MKKVLFTGTALAVAGLMGAGAASASDKIKLNLGGFSKWWVVGAWQDDAFQRASGVDYNSVDVKGDNEVYFSGATTLDNGMKVGVKYELEAGGHTDQGNLDKSFAYVESGFGKVIIGVEDNGAKLLHVSAPDAAGNSLAKDDVIIARPGAVTKPRGGFETPIGGKADGVTYVAPTVMGLTVGASYLPNLTANDRSVTAASEVYGVGALYAAKFGDVGLKASAGWATYDSLTQGDKNSNDWSGGAQLTYSGFTLGGSYRSENHSYRQASVTATTTSTEGAVWDVGVQYATGPYAVSLKYFQSETEGLVQTTGDDTMKWVQASGKYTMGPGVDLLASVLHVDYSDESTANAPANNNKGWAVMTGLSLGF